MAGDGIKGEKSYTYLMNVVNNLGKTGGQKKKRDLISRHCRRTFIPLPQTHACIKDKYIHFSQYMLLTTNEVMILIVR